MREDPSLPPRQIWRHCEYCGLWKSGPFKDRYDVPEDELRAGLRAAGSEPHERMYYPAPFREGGVYYAAGEKPMITSHGPCKDCQKRYNEEHQRRYAAAEAALTKPKGERTPGYYDDRPEPMEEEARKLLSGQDDEGGEEDA